MVVTLRLADQVGISPVDGAGQVLGSTAAVPAHFLTRFRAAIFPPSTPCIPGHFPSIFCQRSLRSPTPLHPMLKLLGPQAAREEVE